MPHEGQQSGGSLLFFNFFRAIHNSRTAQTHVAPSTYKSHPSDSTDSFRRIAYTLSSAQSLDGLILSGVLHLTASYSGGSGKDVGWS